MRLSRMPRLLTTLFALVILLSAAKDPLGAQENYEIQVYGSETMAPGRTMFTTTRPRTMATVVSTSK